MDVEPKPLKSKLISIRLPMVMIRNLRIIARARGDIGYQQIIKTYIAEGLERDHQKQAHASLQWFGQGAQTDSNSLDDNSDYSQTTSGYMQIT